MLHNVFISLAFYSQNASVLCRHCDDKKMPPSNPTLLLPESLLIQNLFHFGGMIQNIRAPPHLLQLLLELAKLLDHRKSLKNTSH